MMNFSFLTILICGLSAGTGVQASDFSDANIMEMMQNTNCSWGEAENALHRLDDTASLRLIQTLQEEEQDAERERQETASLDLIRRLQEEETVTHYTPTSGGWPVADLWLPEPTASYVFPVSYLTGDHKTKLGVLFSSAQAFDNANVHGFNKEWSKGHIAEVQEIFTAHMGTPAPHSFAELRAAILAYQNTAPLCEALDKLAGYSGTGYADEESGVANTLTILSQNWHLASTDIGLSRDFVFDESGVAKNSRDFIIQSLLENAATGGGCAPGYAGRFMRDQLILLCVQAGVDH